MTAPLDRRAFLGRLAAYGLAGPSLPLLGCGADAPEVQPTPTPGPSDPVRVTRPVLVPWRADAVRIAAPLNEVPMAYVSMGRREVFVDRAYRDRASFVLRVHISVSTGLWRIPLRGDPPREPITPGDELREFEELDISRWDPALEPAAGDIRLRRGRPEAVRIEVGCLPVAAAVAWVSGGPFELRRCAPGGDEACREDFVEVGVGTRRALHGCDGPGVPTRLWSWACVA